MILRFIITSNWKKSERENIKSQCRTVNILSQSFLIVKKISYLGIKLPHGDLANIKTRSACGGFVLTEKNAEI